MKKKAEMKTSNLFYVNLEITAKNCYSVVLFQDFIFACLQKLLEKGKL